jgi:hypothetical protein
MKTSIDYDLIEEWLNINEKVFQSEKELLLSIGIILLLNDASRILLAEYVRFQRRVSGRPGILPRI